ncbi:cytochrome c3 family protein [Ferrimonas balearica]|uniref:cytochrome c3 family protein n=1 Tax=Ferrimonas balearica TaxID=44012 RepID=UPI001C9920C5|nr:cytochrome c3 family protein [Ferrimonas balearica]MBY5991060.1 cytochrome c3 family protein [Ferrimonas balearica]
MFKQLLIALFGASMAFGVAAAEVVSDMHTDMSGCETCHADGMPSDDGAHEAASCLDCHGGLTDMGTPHPEHDGMLECTDCHNVHEDEVGQAPATCDNCH